MSGEGPAATIVALTPDGKPPCQVLGHVNFVDGRARASLHEPLIKRASPKAFVAAQQLVDRLHARPPSTLEELRAFARRQAGPVRLVMIDESLPDALRASAPPN